LEASEHSRISTAEIRDLYHPDDFESHQRRLEEHLTNRTKPYESVHRFYHADGTYRWYRAVGHATETKDGSPQRVIGMLTDIDDERRMTEALRLSEARISTLLDNSPSSIYFKDSDLRMVIANRKYLEMYGLSPDNAFGKTSLELFGEDQGRPYFNHDKEVLEKSMLIAREETLNERDLLTFKFPIIDSDGALAGVGGIEIDITERKEVERAYKGARDDAEAANRAKSAFLAKMSHELRTPLNSVIGFSESLLTGTLGNIDNEKHREYISIINSAGSYLLELINDILDLSRIESGHVTLDEDTFDTHPVITSAITFSQDKHANKVIDIRNMTPDNLPNVRADKRQLRQVMINLLTNSLKFTPSGGVIKISVYVTDAGGFEISVEDNGMGISPEDLERVKQPFVQVADSMTRQHEGTGLGLAIVRSIAELHDADFNLESQVGVATKATLTLPASRVVG
jgi:two-component system cell cycle sensor histidine kinase PleC